MRPHLRWSSFLLLAALSTGADWDRFRGPNGSGIAEATGLPAAFGPNKNLIWKTSLPPGHSSPILSRDRIFLTGVDKEKLYLIAMDRRTGRIVWRRESPRVRAERLHKLNNPASATPASDGTRVYVFFGDYGLVCYGWDGREMWRTPLGPFNNVYGMGVSPIVVEDSVVLVVDQLRDSYIAAFKKTDGTSALEKNAARRDQRLFGAGPLSRTRWSAAGHRALQPPHGILRRGQRRGSVVCHRTSRRDEVAADSGRLAPVC